MLPFSPRPAVDCFSSREKLLRHTKSQKGTGGRAQCICQRDSSARGWGGEIWKEDDSNSSSSQSKTCGFGSFYDSSKSSRRLPEAMVARASKGAHQCVRVL